MFGAPAATVIGPGDTSFSYYGTRRGTAQYDFIGL